MKSRKMLKKVMLDSKVRAVDWSQDGTMIGVGMGSNESRGGKEDGAISILSTESMSLIQARDSENISMQNFLRMEVPLQSVQR